LTKHISPACSDKGEVSSKSQDPLHCKKKSVLSGKEVEGLVGKPSVHDNQKKSSHIARAYPNSENERIGTRRIRKGGHRGHCCLKQAGRGISLKGAREKRSSARERRKAKPKKPNNSKKKDARAKRNQLNGVKGARRGRMAAARNMGGLLHSPTRAEKTPALPYAT